MEESNLDNYQKIIFEFIAIQNWNGVEEILNNKKIDPDIRDSAGNYLIHLLIYNNKIKLLNILLKLEPRLDILDPDGKQICYLPIRYNQLEILRLLLKYNEFTYGIDITNFRDANQLSPLFYCIKFNSYNGAKLLLDYGARINTYDKERNTALHIACLNNKEEITKLFINYFPEMNNAINLEKRIPLHNSIISANENIVKTLIKKAENNNILNYLLNSQDINDRTPLMYAIELHKQNLFEYLLNTNMDLQDADGNTHYHLGLKFNVNIEIFKIPNNEILKKTDIDGNTILHLLYLKKLNYFFPDILKNSSFLIQNNNGDTILHFMLQSDINKYKEILEKQKLSIFLINKNGESPYTIMKKQNEKEFNKFIEIVIESYYNQLKDNKDKEYVSKWENECSNNSMNKDECRENIINNINNGISFPQKRKNYCIDITKKMVIDTSYTGITLDIIGGLLLIKDLIKGDNVVTSLELDIISNTKLTSFYTDNRIIRNDFLNFEIIWAYQSIFFPNGLDKLFLNYLNGKKRYFVIPIGIELSQGSHSNILLYDKELNILERFEPDGSKPPNGFYYFPDELDTNIYQFFNKLIDEYNEKEVKDFEKKIKFIYSKPIDSTPRISFQRYEIMELNTRLSDPRGFCGAWCAWYIYQRIKSGIKMKKLIPKLLQKIRGNNLSFKQVVRNYANLMANIREKILKSSNITLDDWFTNINIYQLELLQKEIKKY